MAKTKKADKKAKKTEEEVTPEVLENEAQETVNEEIEVEAEEVEQEEETTETAEETAEKPAAELSEEQKDFRDMYIRLMAEFDNYRKRTQREKADLIRFGNKELMSSMLPILDDLGRTLEAIEKTDNLTSVKDGIKLVSKNIHQIFTKQGIEPMDSKGKEFDTNLHEAIGSLDMGEEHQGKVIEEVEKGYRYKDQVARYAKVIVGD